MDINTKLTNLKQYLSTLGNVAVAFSAGVDSSFLLNTAYEVLGDNVVALTAKSPLIPEREFDEAVKFCQSKGIRHFIVDIDIDCIRHNPQNRCYICKKNIFEKFLEVAKAEGIEYVLEGSNADDINDYRPGMQAVTELGIKSPLLSFGFTKAEIRELSKNQKPSFACLASRFVYGEEITSNRLKMVENAEQLLFDLGFKQFRVRIHENLARIEVFTEDFEKLLNNKKLIVSEFKTFGFDYVTMDLAGYRTGSMNEVIDGK